MDYDVYINITFLLVSIILAGLLAVPIINLLYKLHIVRQISVDFSTIIEDRKKKLGTPIMGGLIIIIPVVLINHFFNLSPTTSIPLIIFVSAATLGGVDDILNIYGKKRKRRTVSRVLKLISVHKNWLVRLKYIMLLPWLIYGSFINAFESNPGKGLFGSERFFIQIFFGLLLGFWTYNNSGGIFWLPFLGEFSIGFLIIPFAIFALLGMTNAVNFSDGMDGLSAGMLLNAFIGFAIVAFVGNYFEISLLASSVVGALLAYLYFNIPPARVQLGDTGSFGLGALITAIAFAIDKPMLLPIIGFPFVVEVSSTIIQALARRLFGRRIFKMAPLHHHFEMLGWSEDKVVMRFWIFSGVFMVLGLWISFF